MKKVNTPLINGIILAAAFLYLAWYFTTHGMWNPATIIVMIVIALLSAGQILIWFTYFKKPKKTGKRNKKG